MINATQIRPGMTVVVKGDLYRVVSMTHVTPGNWRGMVQTRLKNLKSGAIVEYRFRSEDRVERATLEQHEMEFLYHDGTFYHFMNTETFEQLSLHQEVLAETVNYLTPGVRIQVEFFEGQPVGVELPVTVDLKVVETEPGLKGATATNSPKPARLETGLMVQVPPFVEVGETVRIDTRDGSYCERAR